MTFFKTWGAVRFTVTKPCGAVDEISVSGRDRWALECLIAAGKRGCTPIDDPAPRWSAYAFNLRALGVEIETVHERHGGPFAGTHARYVLRCDVRRTSTGEAA